MRIAFFTNTYLPHVGGVARSVSTFEEIFRAAGHEVRVVAPEFPGQEPDPRVLRVPAFQHFNGSDFSVRIPIPKLIGPDMEDFAPEIVHSHHPFLLGDAALRTGCKLGVPVVFTHHTLYERYTHYVPFDSPAMKRMATRLATSYCNLCDHVIAPSQSVAELLRARGVTTPVSAVPTGIDTARFARGDGARFRETHGIGPDACVIGTVGRLAEEKNLLYLAEAVAHALAACPTGVFLAVGEGPAKEKMLKILRGQVDAERVRAVGKLQGDALVDAYAAMNVFVFASQTETQGIVLAEAMAAGNPVVALDASGVREILRDGENGYLLESSTPPESFAEVLKQLTASPERMAALAEGARAAVKAYDAEVCAGRVLELYERLIDASSGETPPLPSSWNHLLEEIQYEWELFSAKLSTVKAGLRDTDRH